MGEEVGSGPIWNVLTSDDITKGRTAKKEGETISATSKYSTRLMTLLLDTLSLN